MHSKLLGLAKPNRLSMPRPAGECPKAVSSEPQAGRVAWRDGEKLTEKDPQGISRGPKTEWPATRGRGQRNAPTPRGSR